MFLLIKFRCPSSDCPCREWTGLTVLARDEKQDIKDWMDYVAQEIANRHLLTSPRCGERRCDIAIPLGSEERGTQAPYIGAPITDDDKLFDTPLEL